MLTGSFINFIIISTLIILHELGHIITAKFICIRTEKIYIYPLGGITKLNIPMNYPHLKEIIIILAGPIFQILAKQILIQLMPIYQNIINTYHYGILIFNLLPIYPLDGGKIINIILSGFLPYKKSFFISIIISYLTIFLFFISNLKVLKLNIFTITIFLIIKTTQEKNKLNIYYEKMLLEKYLYKQNNKDTKIIKRTSDFYRNKSHIILENNKYYLEDEYLTKKYKKIQKKC